MESIEGGVDDISYQVVTENGIIKGRLNEKVSSFFTSLLFAGLPGEQCHDSNVLLISNIRIVNVVRAFVYPFALFLLKTIVGIEQPTPCSQWGCSVNYSCRRTCCMLTLLVCRWICVSLVPWAALVSN